ncbi:hypothetical protein A4A49_20276 [Nicotiana attenuata]|uniref:Uncharacterized protein n=2 Tax=Nicotiana attenuata TaxID=49451 RepID=A0A314L3L3_NICAT|nr:hypothetical protein A4A49_20276 [Nicotiana attenuata]
MELYFHTARLISLPMIWQWCYKQTMLFLLITNYERREMKMHHKVLMIAYAPTIDGYTGNALAVNALELLCS